MACRFPDASSPEAFWANLAAGRDSVGDVPRSRWDAAGLFDPTGMSPGSSMSRWGAFLGDIEGFDAAFFRIREEEARVMDPQQRLLLAVGYEALERAGYGGARRAGVRVGVFVTAGDSGFNETLLPLVAARMPLPAMTAVGNLRNLVAARLNHAFGLRGPALAVDTACSSALVALHLARQSLESGECDLALVGGVSVLLSATPYVLLSRARALSPTGRSRAFSADADGFVPGEGAACLLLGRLEDAALRGDPVLGVVRATAINNDGGSISPMAPNPAAQREVLADAYRRSGVDPATVSYVEAHGTGTRVGDRIETQSIAATYPLDPARPRYVGSVKTNIGHLLQASAMPALLKVLLAFRHGALPPSLHCEQVDPSLGLETAGLEVVRELSPWSSDEPLRAAVDSFGFGGTNAHAVLEAPPPRPPHGSASPIFVALSAMDEPRLAQSAAQLAEHATDPRLDGAVAHSATSARAPMPHRVAGVLDGPLSETLAALAQGELPKSFARGHVSRRTRARLVFLFSGQGAQYPGQGAGLWSSEPGFAERFEALSARLGDVRGRSLSSWCFDDAGSPEELARTDVAQPLLVAFELAVARFAEGVGVVAECSVGHSVGELAALALAGALEDDAAVALAAERGEIMASVDPRGAMMVAFAPEAAVVEALCPWRAEAAVAAYNGPAQLTVSGAPEALADIADRLDADGHRTAPLKVSRAFHSPLVDPVLGRLRALGDRLSSRAPTRPLMSTLTAQWLTHRPDGDYLERHARSPVRFDAAIGALVDDGFDTFVEVGPGASLAGLVRSRPASDGQRPVALAWLRRRDDDAVAWRRAAARLWVRGVDLDLSRMAGARPPARVPVPAHRLRPTRLWPAAPPPARASVDAPHRFLVGRSVATFDRAVFVVHVGAAEAIVAQHEVHGRPLVPGAGIIELALAAAQRALGAPPAGLADVAFAAPMAGGEAATLELRRQRDDLLFEVEQGERPIARGRVLRSPGSTLAPPQRSEMTSWSPAELYDELRARGMHHGRAFQRIVELTVADEVAEARLAPHPVPPDLSLDPFQLDAALQVAAALLLRRCGAADEGLLIPFHIERLALHGGRGVRSRARLRSTRGAPLEMAVVDVALEDDAGRPVIEVWGLSLRRVASESSTPSAARRQPEHPLVHRVSYVPSPLVPADLSRQRLVGAPGRFAEAMCGELERRGAAGRVVEATGLSRSSSDEVLLFAGAGVATALAAARALAEAAERPRALRVVTFDHVLAVPSDRARAEPAAVLGLARALGDELGIPVGFVDLRRAEETATNATALVHECCAEVSAAPVAWRAGARFERHLVSEAMTGRRKPASVEGGAYLITGGATGVGLCLARGLAARGAGGLALVGRTALAEDPPRRAAVDELRRHVEVFYRSVDVLERSALDVLVRDTMARFGRLDGVFHAAGVAEPGAVSELEVEGLERVVAPKRRGAENLIAALLAADAKPSFVALVSSISANLPGLAGGLASYAAANAHLDALADAAGSLPIRSLAYGAWAGTGLGSSRALEARLAARGLPAMEPESAVEATFRALDEQGPRHIIARFDRAASAAPPEESSEVGRVVRVATEPVPALLQRLVAEALGVPPAHVPTDAPFLNLGLESLAAVDLVKQLEAHGAGRLPTTLFFEYQTIAELATYLAPLMASVASASRELGPPASRALASPVQVALHTQHRLHPEVPAFAFLCQRLDGVLDLETLASALRQLELRHPMLRTRFETGEGGRPERRLDAPTNDPWPPWLSVLSAGADLQRAETEAMNRLFVLDRGPLFHVTVAPEGAGRHVLWLTLHHAIGDAWSLQVFAADLWTLYAATAGHGPALAALEADVVDRAIAEEQESRRGELHGRALEYFAALAPQLERAGRATLPYDGDPSAAPRGDFRVVHIDAPAATSEALPLAARRLEVTPFVVLLAAAFRALGRWSNQSALAIPVAVAGRDARVAQLERAMGCFADALPVFVDAGPERSFAELVRTVDEALRSVLRHGSVRSLDLASTLPRVHGRAPSAGPLSFSFARFPGADVPDAAVVPRDLRGATATAATRLGLAAYEWRGELRFAWTYPSGLFEAGTVHRLAREYGAILDEVVRARPSSEVSTPSSAAAGVLGRFLANAERRPEAAALIEANGHVVSHRSLAERATAVGASLRASPPGAVGVVAARGAGYAAAVLGAMLAGRTFVPLDPAHPVARTGACGGRAGVVSMLFDESGREHAARLASERSWTAHDVTALPSAKGARPEPRWSASDIAYVMFTSGSTGEPKGVPISRGALERYVAWARDALGFGSDVRSAWTASPAFDATLRQLLAPLSCAGVVAALDAPTLRDPERLARVVDERRLDIFAGVPTLLTSWAQAVERTATARCSGLRFVHSGGEVLSPGLLRRLRAALPSSARVINLYGPTEATINASYHIDKGAGAVGELVPIGHAAAGARLSVGGPEPGQRRGELWISGPGLSTGYLDDGSATARAFEVDGRGRRWYRTGDEVEALDDGALVFLRRLDAQVQVRGHRVEPAEVSAALRSLPGVHGAEVVGAADGTSLIANVQVEEGVEAPALRRALAELLPAFMVPAELALVSASDGRVVAPAVAQAPRTATEALVAEAFGEVLGHRVGREADFFDQGGDSLSLLRVFDLLLERLSALPRPAVVYADATVAGLAAAIDAHADAPPDASPRPARGSVLPVGPTQAGFLLTEALAPEQQPLWRARFWLEGALDRGLFQAAVDAAVRRHAMLRVSFPEGARSRHMVQLDESHRVVVAYSDLEAEPAEAVELAWRAAARTPVPLDEWPQLRLSLHRCSPTLHALFVVAHHVVGDGYSGELLLRELARDYDALAEGRPVDTSPLRSSYCGYVRRRRAVGLSDEAVAHWRSVFDGPFVAPSLRPRDRLAAGETRSVTRLVPASRLEGVGRRALPGLVLAAYHQALAALTGQQDLVIGVATAGRFASSPDLHRVFGPFALSLPVRLGAAGRETPKGATAALDAAQRHAVDAASIVRACDGATTLRVASGAQFFFTHLDFSALGPVASAHLQLRADGDHTAVTPTSIATDVLCVSAPDDSGLRLIVHGAASALELAALESLADEVAAAVAELARWPAAPRGHGRAEETAAASSADAALVGYLPSVESVAASTGLPADDLAGALRERFFPGGAPRHVETSDTPFGRSAFVAIPWFADELVPGNAERVEASVVAALSTSRRLGARSASLAGVLPALLGYGLALDGQVPVGLEVTTGHAATVVAVLATLEAVVRRLGLPPERLSVAVVGVGSIGRAAIERWLAAGSAPRHLVLCDRAEASDAVRRFADELRRAGLRAEVEVVVGSAAGLPEQVYGAELILGAATAPGLLDVARVRPGTVVVDDSFPHLFDAAAARVRMQRDSDVLFVGAGLAGCDDVRHRFLLDDVPLEARRALSDARLPNTLPGCQLEALLRLAEPRLVPVRGLVDAGAVAAYQQVAQGAGVCAAPLHLEAYRPTAALLERVAELARARLAAREHR